MAMHAIIITPPDGYHCALAAVLSEALRSGMPSQPADVWVSDEVGLPQLLKTVVHLKNAVAWVLSIPIHNQALEDQGLLRRIGGQNILAAVEDVIDAQKKRTTAVTLLLQRLDKLEHQASAIIADVGASDERLNEIESRLPVLLLPPDMHKCHQQMNQTSFVDSELLSLFHVATDEPLLDADTDDLLLLHSLVGSSPLVAAARNQVRQILGRQRKRAVVYGSTGTGKSKLLETLARRLQTTVLNGNDVSFNALKKTPVLIIDNVHALQDNGKKVLHERLLHKSAGMVIVAAPLEQRHALERESDILRRMDSIVLPSLLDRAQDIGVIACSMLALLHRKLGLHGMPIDLNDYPEAISKLTRASWHENLCGLEKCLTTALQTKDFSFEMLAHHSTDDAAIRLPQSHADLAHMLKINEVVQQYIESVYQLTGSKITTAQLLGWTGSGGRNAVSKWLNGKGKLAE